MGHERRASTEEHQGTINRDNAEPTNYNFQERVNRHGREFGDRVSTKQTLNPPKYTHLTENSTTWRQKSTYEKDQGYSSPSYLPQDLLNAVKTSSHKEAQNNGVQYRQMYLQLLLLKYHKTMTSLWA
ncbi:hypothetical protein HID58_044118 [Brassica napus]|uniref:Uncharacterized protein n=1 Tax=Brassica napus TaxID=3708 RepID=A0ABQ8BK43_BRANA|nr:hypothetical protein HID58_044118 [Brassica napus]